MRELDEGKRATRELRHDAANDFLMRMLGHRDVERGLAKLDGEHVEEPDEDERQVAHERHLGRKQVGDGKRSGRHEHANGHEKHHGLVGHDLHRLTLGTEVGVRRT